MQSDLFNYIQTVKHVSCMTGEQFTKLQKITGIMLTMVKGKLTLFVEIEGKQTEKICEFQPDMLSESVFDDTLELGMFLRTNITITESAQAELTQRANHEI